MNADDFGISPGVNRGIVQAHRQGIVTSASLMANVPGAVEAVEMAADSPALELGLHLNLTAGRPISPPHLVPALLGRDGRLLPPPRLLWRLSLGMVPVEQMEREMVAQVERALALGARITHLDSHHHVHIHPRVRPVVLAVARRFGIQAVRCPDRPASASPSLQDFLRQSATGLGAFGLRRAIRRAGLLTADRFVDPGRAFDSAALERALRHLPDGLLELMCHPGYPDPALAEATSYTVGREREVAALTAKTVRDLVRDLQIELVGWQRVRASP